VHNIAYDEVKKLLFLAMFDSKFNKLFKLILSESKFELSDSLSKFELSELFLSKFLTSHALASSWSGREENTLNVLPKLEALSVTICVIIDRSVL